MLFILQESTYQPIHLAARYGQCGVIRSLINEYELSPMSEAKVCKIHFVIIIASLYYTHISYRMDYILFILLPKEVTVM